MDTPEEGAPPGNDGKGLDLTPPIRGFQLYRHKNAEGMKTKNWHGYYWARVNEAGDYYEIRSVPAASGERSMPGGLVPREGFEEHYEKVNA